jgi:hypothetical protein
MRRTALGAAMLVLISSLACRKQKSSETGGVTDTVSTPAAAPAVAPPTPDTSTGVQSFGFDQRQQFAQSIRQQLGDIDRQIQELSAQAKSRGGAVSDRALANIRTARRAVDGRLARVNTATAANWEQIKTATNRSVESLSESIEAAQPK